MTCEREARAPLAAGLLLKAIPVPVLLVFLSLSGCGGKLDPRFSAPSYDEYTEPLTDAVIGSPSGTIVVAAAKDRAGPQETAAAAPAAAATPGSGFWHFDDCSPDSHFLADSSGGGTSAQQALGAACVPGAADSVGVQIRTSGDVIQVPDEPQFTLDRRVAVAAWVYPNTVSGNQPIVIKRLGNQTAFSLGIHDGNIEMAVVLTTGTTFISRAPIAAGTWTHVGGMYDGTFVFLFINGQQFGQVYAGGTLRNVFAPIRIGATTQTQHFDGVVDEVFLSTEAIDKSVITSQACFSRPSTLIVSPESSGPVPFDTPFHYDIAVTDHDFGFCAPRFYNLSFNFFDPGISVNPFFNSGGAGPGETFTFGEDVTGSQDAEPAVHLVRFDIFDFTPNFGFEYLFGQLTFELKAPDCFVSKRRELMITSTSVVDDPVRTSGVGLASPSLGVWTLGHLLREMAPTPADAPAMALQLFQTWLSGQTVNGFTVAARPAAQQRILDIWPKTAAGELDLDQAPFRLQAIVSRVDLRDLNAGSAGQGRFVFALNDSGGFSPQPFTVILEYNLPAQTPQEVLDWAGLWHGLSSHPFPSEEYNAALEEITRRFADRNAAPGGVNGSSLRQCHTNEFALSFDGRWEFRQFELSPATGFFQETPVGDTPDLGFNGTQAFADFVNQNEGDIIAKVPGAPTSIVPLQLEGDNFRAGAVFNDLVTWSAPGIANPEARFHASLNTCNGCHGPETNTFFLMVGLRTPGQEAFLSPFLTGTTVFDPVTFQPRTLNDLARRQTDLTSLVCP